MEETWELAALAMPEWMRYKGWKFHVYIGDTTHRPHVHIAKPRQEVKIWLDTFEIADVTNVKPKDVRDLKRETERKGEFLMRKWKEQFPDG